MSSGSVGACPRGDYSIDALLEIRLGRSREILEACSMRKEIDTGCEPSVIAVCVSRVCGEESSSWRRLWKQLSSCASEQELKGVRSEICSKGASESPDLVLALSGALLLPYLDCFIADDRHNLEQKMLELSAPRPCYDKVIAFLKKVREFLVELIAKVFCMKQRGADEGVREAMDRSEFLATCQQALVLLEKLKDYLGCLAPAVLQGEGVLDVSTAFDTLLEALERDDELNDPDKAVLSSLLCGAEMDYIEDVGTRWEKFFQLANDIKPDEACGLGIVQKYEEGKRIGLGLANRFREQEPEKYKLCEEKFLLNDKQAEIVSSRASAMDEWIEKRGWKVAEAHPSHFCNA